MKTKTTLKSAGQGVAEGAAETLLEKSRTATGWKKILLLIGAGAAAAVAWLLGEGASQNQPAPAEPPAVIEKPTHD